MPEAISSNNPELNLDSFEKEICVRQLRGDDFERIVALQQRCFPNMACHFSQLMRLGRRNFKDLQPYPDH